MSNLFRDNIYNEFPDPNKKIEELGEQLADTKGLNENKYTYSYLPNGSVGSIIEKDKNNTVIGTTTFTYKTNGDIDTSVLLKDGQTITTQYIYDTNGNLTDTINTRS